MKSKLSTLRFKRIGLGIGLILALILGAFALTSLGETIEPPETELKAILEVPATLPSGEAVNLRFTLINNTDTRLYVLEWFTPLEGIAGEIFHVERDGQVIPYEGILAYRGDPTPDAYVLLDAGESVSAEVDLETAYDFSKAGEYTIEFVSPSISYVARTETEMAKTVDDLAPVQIPSNRVTTKIASSSGETTEEVPIPVSTDVLSNSYVSFVDAELGLSLRIPPGWETDMFPGAATHFFSRERTGTRRSVLILSVLGPDSNTLESALEEVTRGAWGVSIKDVQWEQLGRFKALRLELAAGEERPPVVWLVIAPSGRAVGFIPEDDLALIESVLDTLRPAKLPRSMKGYELHSWQVQGEWYFALVMGTNRIKTYDEIASPEVSVRGLDTLKSEVDQLPSGQQVFWLTQRVPNMTLPPGEMIDEIRAYCGQRGIKLEIEPIDNEGSYLPKTVPVVTVVMASSKAEIMGYISDLYEQDGHPYISFDEIEWLTGADAAQAMREDELCSGSESDCEPPSPFYIRNRDEKPMVLRVSEQAAIFMQTLSHGPDGNFNWDERIDLDRFRQIVGGDSTSHLRSVPYQITVDSGVVTTIREQYVP